ncbi:MAG TPA: delta-60 repeat domain-containing protein, partial [Alkalispirochaeta sp.]|nr:delta-60 repeat domain-containing protein [Alkalispirochaeta sp.]
QSDGKLVLVGSFLSYEEVSRGFIARIDPADGGLDTTFDPSSGANNVVFSVAAQDDGKLVIGGLFAAFNGTLIDKLARVDSGGTIDGTFDPSDGPSNAVSKIAPLAGNELLIGGAFKANDGNTVHGIARVDSSGSRDTSFAPAPGTNASNPSVADMEQTADQRIIIVGSFTSYNGINRGRIARIWH